MEYKYLPHYDDKTSIRFGELPLPKEIFARQELMREIGFTAGEEVWKKGYGYVPIYYFVRELTKDEQNLLCLCPLTDETADGKFRS